MPRSGDGSLSDVGPGHHGRLSSVSKLFTWSAHGIEAPIVNKLFLMSAPLADSP